MSENPRVKYYCADRESSSKCHTFCIDVFDGEGNQAPHLFAIIGHRETANTSASPFPRWKE